MALEVWDDGRGIDPVHLLRVFDPFFSTHFAGARLGLPAVLGIVRGNGGGIEIDSEAGRGTRVRIVLPRLERPGRRDAPSPTGTTGGL